jgi:hypothetical protein
MGSRQRKAGASLVIVLDRAPCHVAMALFALVSKPTRVRVIGPMAADAGRGYLDLVVAATVAIGALDTSVPSGEGKTRLLRMIERRRIPLRGVVAAGAVGATCSTMYVIGGVTARAHLWSLFVVATDVAGIAAQLLVSAGQRE